MENKERLEKILTYLKERHFASVAEIAEAHYISGATARRDIAKLEARGAVKSVYGGVVISEYEKAPIPSYLREKENSSVKEVIARAAAEFIKDNSTMILDSSSTVRRICKYIKKRNGLTVITNSLSVCRELMDTDIKVLSTGGELIKERECFVGHIAEEFLRSVRADMLFFSSQGLSERGDITDSSAEETSLRRAMLAAAKEKYFLCDTSKKNREYLYKLCSLTDVNKAIFD